MTKVKKLSLEFDVLILLSSKNKVKKIATIFFSEIKKFQRKFQKN
jgi:hypothetical protein